MYAFKKDVSREELEKRRERIQERKAEWEMRGKRLEEKINCENGGEECTEFS